MRARHGLPLVATYHTFFEDYLHHYVPILPRAIGRFLARRFTLSQCDDVAALIAPSAPMRDALLAYGVKTPIEVLPTGLPAESFRPATAHGFASDSGSNLAGRWCCTWVVSRTRRTSTSCCACSCGCAQRCPEALFVIAGEGPARAHLMSLAQDLEIDRAVRFIGYLERNSELPDCYAAGDAFVFASRTETQGLVLLEAMAQGTPVVSTAELGTRSILTPGCGAFVVPEDEAVFADGVAQALDLAKDDPRRGQLRAHARNVGVAGHGAAPDRVLRESGGRSRSLRTLGKINGVPWGPR